MRVCLYLYDTLPRYGYGTLGQAPRADGGYFSGLCCKDRTRKVAQRKNNKKRKKEMHAFSSTNFSFLDVKKVPSDVAMIMQGIFPFQRPCLRFAEPFEVDLSFTEVFWWFISSCSSEPINFPRSYE